MRGYRVRVRQRISTRAHGVVDYVFASSVLATSRAAPASETLRRLLERSALGVVVMSALTRYELGLVKVLPMRAHLALDLVVGALFSSAPILLPRESRATTRVLAGLGLAGTAVAVLTVPSGEPRRLARE